MVGMLADRTPADETTVELRSSGHGRRFRLARSGLLMRRPVIFMTGLYAGGARYDVHFETLADFSTTPRGNATCAIDCDEALRPDLLRKHCRASPYNWFNFFPFWSEQSDNDLFARIFDAQEGCHDWPGYRPG